MNFKELIKNLKIKEVIAITGKFGKKESQSENIYYQ